MKFFFELGFLFIFHMYYAFCCECINDIEKYDEDRTPLIYYYNIIQKDSQIDSEQYEETSCWNFIQIFFSRESNESTLELKRGSKDFFSILPSELIVYIGSFLDPLSTITLSQTYQGARMIFSTSYWQDKCTQEKLQSWNRNISPEKVYFSNFWYKNQHIKMVKKAALIGHPESKEMLQTMQANIRKNKLQSTKIYVESSGYFDNFRKWRG